MYDVLHKLLIRLQGKSVALVLSRRQQAVYDEINHIINTDTPSLSLEYRDKKRLAFVSPLPPLRSGISDYSADLLPLLAKHYDIDVIVDQDTITDAWVNDNCMIRSGEWLRANPSYYDRVLYHFGNSPFHEYMFDLLDTIPGVVVLHDFFLGHIAHKRYDKDFAAYLYRCHGYRAIKTLNCSESRESSVWAYPLNFELLQKALNIIVHSPHSQRLAKQFYGNSIADNWAIIPLLRVPAESANREQSRAALTLNDDRFMACSFGLTGPIKLSHRLLDAWLASDLAKDERCILVFVGENDGGEYGSSLLARINECGLSHRIYITGWIDNEQYRHYLCAADVGVQLRTRSRGETSAAALDCMNYGLATIVNANGAMVDFADDAVYKLQDEFSDAELMHALNKLWHNNEYRQNLSSNAKNQILLHHAPASCAHAYINTIESAYSNNQPHLKPLLEGLLSLEGVGKSDDDLRLLSQAVAHASPPHAHQRQLLIDISAIVVNDLRTGIQRVVRAQLEVLLRHPPKGCRVEPVYLSDKGGQWHFNYAHQWTSQFLNIPNEISIEDEAADFDQGDILFCADLCTGLAVHADNFNVYQSLISSGIKVFFQVFDLLPISHPKWFPKEAEEAHSDWARIVAKSSGAICISQAVANEFEAWCGLSDDLNIGGNHARSFHLGADIDTSSPSTGLPEDADDILVKMASAPSLLMVGTIEPRKGQEQALAAIEILWQQGVKINLVIVGKAGWMVDRFINKLSVHPEFNHHLFWLESISDEFLGKVYSASSCLIAASEGEGFGLPLIEAAQHQLPIIARDIPVFREVAGDFAYYFSGLDPSSLATAINSWLNLNKQGDVPSSAKMPWLTWQESTEKVVQLLGLEPTS